jgi:Flp pilus assembly pilin Flp
LLLYRTHKIVFFLILILIKGVAEMRRATRRKRQKGQALVEYIIIIVIVAIAALAVMGIFSDRVRTIIAGAASSLGADNAADAVDNNAIDIVKEMDADGIDFNE